jgi:hypothetical protein
MYMTNIRRVHESVMTGSRSLERVTQLLRRGYIMGQHAYEAGTKQTPSDECRTKQEKDGFLMGWAGRYADEMADLEPSQFGYQGGCHTADDLR